MRLADQSRNSSSRRSTRPYEHAQLLILMAQPSRSLRLYARCELPTGHVDQRAVAWPSFCLRLVQLDHFSRDRFLLDSKWSAQVVAGDIARRSLSGIEWFMSKCRSSSGTPAVCATVRNVCLRSLPHFDSSWRFSLCSAKCPLLLSAGNIHSVADQDKAIAQNAERGSGSGSWAETAEFECSCPPPSARVRAGHAGENLNAPCAPS